MGNIFDSYEFEKYNFWNLRLILLTILIFSMHIESAYLFFAL